MKKNIVLVVISLLLLCSLLMNAGFIYILYDERVIEGYKTLHCPMQMAAVTELQNECLIIMEAEYADSIAKYADSLIPLPF